MNTAVRSSRRRGPSTWLPPLTSLAFFVAVIAVAAVALFSYQSSVTRQRASMAASHAMQVIGQVQVLLSSVKDAETGQRGYLLTGSEEYVAPFSNARSAIPGQFRALNDLVVDNPQQLQQASMLQELVSQKLDELGETVELRRSGKAEAALAVVRSDRGKDLMDRIRNGFAQIEDEERTLFARRSSEWDDAVTVSLWMTVGGSAALLVLIVLAAYITSRDFRSREAESWVRAGLAALSQRMQGDLRLEQLSEKALNMLADYLGAQVGAFYAVERGGRLQFLAGYATAPDMAVPEAQSAANGLLGQAVRDNRLLRVENVPDGHLPVASSLGTSTARELVIVPASIDGRVQCVLELGFFRTLDANEMDLLQRMTEALAMAMRASRDRTQLEELLEETQRQSEELQTQQEELRVSNEELEEQSRALKESQVQLENQQVELEQTNTQLEEQSHALQLQRDDLTRSQAALAARATELTQANRYKSEFLANMSHELRTPLNSTLILAKLLADNKDDNLSDEQVQYAKTISSAGNDLLNLINDILDLSKIEAGKVDVDPQPVPLARLADHLRRTFEPVAKQRGIGFGVVLDGGLPDQIVTDEIRCAQILRNLLSNAIKFTEQGEVKLRVSLDGGQLRFAVSDTGIGIAEGQRDLVFEAFRQADGSTHRKYGGTGLGLAISRDLSRLLGGDISLQSVEGRGSVFTLSLPPTYSPALAPSQPQVAPGTAAPLAVAPAPLPAAQPLASPLPAGAPTPAAQTATLDDDRDDLRPGDRLILAIEDDLRFAEILRKLIRELDFRCVIAGSAGEGVRAAHQYRPSAILLDMNLPDHSGLGVLDQLKRSPQTRHIPVHVISVADYSHEAFGMGAVGYAFKPVNREQLVEAIRKIDAKLSQTVKRVLVVEDDTRQRESVEKLLGSDGVQITGVATAAGALQELKHTTYDCVVMDLSLPDLSGYELLERMATDEETAFPPVIVYTGHSLTRDEEQQLRRFSRSIIIKGARSPERLLDEVTLFLHQVETNLPPAQQKMLKVARDREAVLEGRRVLVVEDDVRNIFALSAVLEPKGIAVEIARNGREAVERLARVHEDAIDLVLMDIMMPEMDGFTAMREIRKRAEFAQLPIIALTAKAMKDDQEKCLAAGANDYIAKPLDVEKLLSLVRVWMPK